MNSKRILILFLVASLAGNVAFLMTALFHRPAQASSALQELSLTQDQTSKFEQSRRVFQEERARAQKRMSELRGVLAEEFQKEAPDRQRLLSAALEMADVQTNMRPKVVDNLLALHELLTPKQRATLAGVMRRGGGSAGCPAAILYSAPEQNSSPNP